MNKDYKYKTYLFIALSFFAMVLFADDQVNKELKTVKIENLVQFRSSILDTKGKPLSVNKMGFSIAIKSQLSSKKKKNVLEKEISFLVDNIDGLDFEKLKKTYIKLDSKYAHNYVKIVDFISYDDLIGEFSKLSSRNNLNINIYLKRYYPYKELASHIIGYVSNENSKENNITSFTGKTGIEKYYDSILEGHKYLKQTKATAPNEKKDKKLYIGSNIILSLDLELQQYVSKLFENMGGTVIIMNANNGQILSAGSFPEYDLNKFVSGISHKEWKSLANDFDHSFTNKLINGLYAPGAIVEMGVALSFLKSGLITPYTNYYCSGSFEFGGRRFKCWKDKGHGKTNLKKAIRESCDDYFYKGSLKIGIDKIAPVLRNLGFGTKTGVDLPYEFVGSVPGRLWKMQKYHKPWYQGETLVTSVGQGYFLTTPMQVAKYTALLAIGYSVTPHFIKNIGGLNIDYDKKSVLTLAQKNNLPFIRKAMREVVSHPKGIGYSYVKTKVDIAGKTGMAQTIGISRSEKKRMKEHELEYYHRAHSWFTTYGPYKKPQYVVTVMVEHSGNSGAVGKIISKIYDKLLDMGYIK